MGNAERAAAAGLAVMQVLVDAHGGLEEDERCNDDEADYLVVAVEFVEAVT